MPPKRVNLAGAIGLLIMILIVFSIAIAGMLGAARLALHILNGD